MAVQFFQTSSQFQFLCQEIDKAEKEAGHIALIVIDTVARSFGAGDENSAKDMGQFIAECDRLKALYGSTVFLVHHTGIADKSRARGSSSLKGAVDAEFKVERYAKDKSIITLTCTKMKDAEYPEPLAFTLRSVDLDITDEEGNPLTSAILDPVLFPDGAEGEGRQRKKTGKNQQHALQILQQLHQKHQHNLEEGDYDPNQAKVKYQDWKGDCIKKMGARRFREVENSLTESGKISKDVDYVYLEPD
ncbi:AAA family ATPase [Desulforegula conservatrix]|uniref:AAA family ATPase n=1 Tax=Desulforegula conservatrix TaxID=153026 RepID=UPI0004022AF0|nr:AAA family ATPase [Desulforegula conservatrix]